MKSLLRSLLVLRALRAFALPHPQDDSTPTTASGDDAALVASVSAAVASASLKPYVVPQATDPITEFGAFGDSFTAGIGSNGLDDYIRHSQDCDRFQQAYPVKMQTDPRLPGDPGSRKLDFGACSGNKIPDVHDKQLSDQPSSGFVAFGKPQLAVMTISGNDLGFFNAINSCVIRAIGWPSIPDCNTVLSDMERKLDDLAFLGEIDMILLAAVVKGRANGGAEPPESFQLFVNGYVPFFNEDDPGCDDVSFGWYSGGKPKLTTQLRRRLNDIVRNLNFQIKRSALRLAGEGVVYVEGFQDAYDGHLFCDPAADPDLENPISTNTWFWANNSPWNGGEGPPTAVQSNYSFPQAILNTLVADDAKRAGILSGEIDPSTVSDAFTSYEKFTAALVAAAAAAPDDLEKQTWPIQWIRIFHPKGTAFSEHARVNVDQILASRGEAASAASQPSNGNGPER